jgi:hypothetical protein
VDLTIVQTNGPGSTPKRFTLRCAPVGGTYPDATTACSKLMALKDIFRPQVGHVMCPNIMADARSYIVSGVFLGQTVHQSILDGGCTTAKWNQLNEIFN